MSIIDPSKIPSGLSWGSRGFRIGKSAAGNWWISLGLPFGFRYTWMLGRKKTTAQEEYASINTEQIGQKLPEQTQPTLSKPKSKIINRKPPFSETK